VGVFDVSVGCGANGADALWYHAPAVCAAVFGVWCEMACGGAVCCGPL
jgi:hypothetical protein